MIKTLQVGVLGEAVGNSRAPAFRSTANKGASRLALPVEKNVVALFGRTVLMLSKPSPSRPSMSASEVNCEDTFVASSTVWLGTARPPTLTVSRITTPLDELSSAYWIDQVAPVTLCAVEDLAEAKVV